MPTWLLLFVIVFEIWYGAAYLIAYLQTRKRLLLLQVAQALLLGAAFGYIALAMLNQWGLNGVLVVVILVAALGLNTLWRRGVAATGLAQSYPRGIIDVLTFRRPATDLKRRVRTK